MEGYSFNSLQAAPGSALAGNSSSLLVQQQQPTSLISQQYYYEYHHQQQPQPQPQPTQHQQPNSTDYLFATSQNSPSIYYTSVDSTQALNSYNTDFTTNSFTAAVSNNNNNTNNNVIYTQTASVADFQPSTIVPESFDFGGGNFLFEESSVFLSPQASSAASSASQSPESKSQYYALSGNAAAAAATDSLDLSLEELLQNIGSEEDNIFGSIGVEDDLALSDELFEALKDVAEGEEGEEDFFSELNFEDAGQLGLLSQGGSSNTATLEISSSSSISSNSSNSSVCSASSDFFLNASFSSSSSNSSVSSTPKRKYSSDSSSSSSSSNSTYCYSEASYQTAASNSSSSSEPEIEATAVAKQSKPASSSSNKRARRTPKASPVEKAARKKDQNKRAACRYRSKKRTELHSSELTMEELEAVRDGLAEQVRKLQTEFGVILPLARAAFAHDAAKRARLQAMLARVDGLL